MVGQLLPNTNEMLYYHYSKFCHSKFGELNTTFISLIRGIWKLELGTGNDAAMQLQKVNTDLVLFF
jgi:hypothetical protein